jgi:hydrogenase maturation protein HypF
MVAGVASARRHADVSSAERALLESAERPVVLLRKRPDVDRDLVDVAPGLAWLGAMLPYTPLHYLLFHEAAGRPAGTGWLADAQDLVLVMTSANPGGEPLVTDNDEALARLAGIADAFLVHDRAIVIRCDDSVVRAGATGPQFVRRARGYTPLAIRLAAPGPSVAAVGGWYKNTVCVTRGDEAFVSQHIGDLDNAPTCAALEEALAHLVAILDVRPEAVAHDLHPDFFSTRHAAKLAANWGVPLVGVQHHHAHIAAVLAEHRVTVPTLGLALDGVGLGADGEAWGGELLLVEGPRSERIGRLRPLRLPGGDRAAREPWRMAAAALSLAGRTRDIATRFGDEPAAPTVARMLAQGINAPETSSMGRWFDAAAGLLGVKRRIAFEGQAAMLLEGLAERRAVATDPALFAITPDNELDLAPIVLRLQGTRDVAFGAALFHATVVAALAAWVEKAARERRIAAVACGGGCFLNAIVSHGLSAALSASRITMLEAQLAPPNDGGLSLGQAWVARQAASGKA